MPTLEINNLGGPLVRKNTGDVNSGFAKFYTSWGYDPYSKPGNLTWLEQPQSILSSVLMMAMKSRLESGNQNNVYAIANGNTLYKILVNSTSSTIGANFDSASVINSNLGADKYLGGGGMEFYGTTEKIFFGGDNLIQKVNFDGSGASVLADTSAGGQPAAGTPRPFANFLGRTYFGNGANLGEIDSTDTIINTAKLSPALPSGMVVSDLDISADGNYLQIIASRANPQNALGASGSGDLGTPAADDSYKFYWNGINTGVTAIESYSGVFLSGSMGKLAFGYDLNGAAIFSDAKKTVAIPETAVPQGNALFSAGDIAGFAAPEYEISTSSVKAAIYNFGSYDSEVSKGLYRLLRQRAATKDDVIAVPSAVKSTNKAHIAGEFGFPNNLSGVEKIYYSTLERSSVLIGANANSVASLWRFSTIPSGGNSVVAGVYETQTQIFPKRISVKQVRIYTEPLVGGNDFTIDLIGSNGSVISGGSQKFTVGTNATAGDEMERFNPMMNNIYALGLRITNASVTGVANWTALKAEIDYEEGGI